MSANGDVENMNADNYVLDLYRKRTFNEAFWAGIKVAVVALALVNEKIPFCLSATVNLLKKFFIP